MKKRSFFISIKGDKPIYVSAHGSYTWKIKKITLAARWNASFNEILDVLIHEINHWASALFLSEKEIDEMLQKRAFNGYHNFSYPQRITERQADWFKQRSKILKRY
jgi:hypothetical protein